MANQSLSLKIKGLYTDPNNFSEVPDGALSIADNIDITKDSVAESRRGQTFYSAALSAPPDRFFNYRSAIIAHYGSKLAYDSNNSGSFVEYAGSYEQPEAGYRMRAVENNRNLYFNTSLGVYKLDSLTATPIEAGAPRGLDGTAAPAGGSGWLSTACQLAYRVLWGYRDRNNNLILGAPSQRIIAVYNGGGGSTNIELNLTIPAGVTDGYIYQVYRSPKSASDTEVPNDELRLVYEANPTSAQIAAKALTFTDVTPESLEGAFLYTSPSQEGIANANETPPFCKDIAVFKGHTFYANTRSKQRATVTLVGVNVDSTTFGYYSSNATATDTSNVLTGITSTTNIRLGMRVTHSNFPGGTVVTEIISGTSVRVSASATSSGTVATEFQDRLTIGPLNLWCGSVENIAINQFKVDVSGSSAANIASTALSIVRVTNRSTTNTTIYAYYLSGYLDLPGQILFEERGVGGSVSALTSTAGGSFNPTLPERRSATAVSVANPTVITSAGHGLTTGDQVTIYSSNSTPSVNGTYTVTVLSSSTFTIPVAVTVAGTTAFFNNTTEFIGTDNEERPNRVMFSKLQQPESVPLFSFVDVGSRNAPIRRAVALRDSVFLFKDDGIFRITGEDVNSFRVSLFDNTATLKAPESAVPFNNQVFLLSDQGVAAVSDNGVQVLSRPIESTLLQLSSSGYANFETATFAVAYESSRQYILFTVSEESDTYATQAFVYNSFTNSWTRWVMPRSAGFINQRDNKLYSGHPVNNRIYKERKEFTLEDYADESYTVTVTAASGSTVTLASVAGVAVGSTFRQGILEAQVTAIDGLDVTLSDGTDWVAGSAEVFTPIPVRLAFVPLDASNPGVVKQFRELTFTFRSAAFASASLSYTTNFTSFPSSSHISPIGTGPWGGFPWGAVAWGGGLGGQQAIRTFIPLQCQRAHWITVSIGIEQAFNSFSFTGLSLIYNKVGERFR